MRKTLILIIFAALCLPSFAQQKGHDATAKTPKIEEIVDDLSLIQKHKLSTIYDETSETLSKLKAEQKEIKDSIFTLLSLPTDESERLFPLFDRENSLRAAIAKEYYSMRLRINEVLNDEQRDKVHKHFSECKNNNKDNKGRKRHPRQ